MHADARKLLWDAQKAATRVARFTHGKTFADYQADEFLRSAVERQLEIVGEALNQLGRIDPATAAAIPDLPRIVGFRNVLIHGYQKVINGARAVLDHYHPHIPIHPDWPMVELGEALTSVGSGVTPRGGKETYVSEGILFIRSQNVLFGTCDFSDAAYITPGTHEEMSRSRVRQGDVFLNITGASIGRSAVMELDIEANVNQHVACLRTKPDLLPLFLSTFLNSDTGQRQIDGFQAGASREALNYSQIRQMKIPLPPLATQQAIVAEIKAEQALVAANRELIDRFEKKIQATLARVWGEEESVVAESPHAMLSC